jgi:AGCS family alanine or glycine:cation symporter
MQAIITEINAWAWGVPMQVLLLGTGVFLTAGLGFLTWIRLGLAFRMLASGRRGRGEGDIPPFRALDDLAQCHYWHWVTLPVLLRR